MTTDTTRVFVYGTLKKGHGNARLLETSLFLGNATVPGQLINIGSFPGLLPPKDGIFGKVQGEIYDVPPETLAQLDLLEANGRMYLRRRAIAHMTSNQQTKIAYAYYWLLATDGFEIIPSGKWELK